MVGHDVAKRSRAAVDYSSSEDDRPLCLPPVQQQPAKRQKVAVVEQPSLPSASTGDGDDDSDDVPLGLKPPQIASVSPPKPVVKEDATPAKEAPVENKATAAGPRNGARKRPRNPSTDGVKLESPAAKTRRQLRVTAENFEPINCWWEKETNSDGTQWSYLEHNGLMFTPAYQPHQVPVIIRGDKHVLPPEAEEVANYWCLAMESDYAKKSRFIKNLWLAFMSRLPEDHVVKTENLQFEDVDFSEIKAYLDKTREALKERRKNFTKADREAEKMKKEAEEGPNMYALIDWLKEKVGSYKSEPPSLFRGRGEHPKMGQLKRRIFPEEVTLNCHADAPVPRLPPDLVGHSWKDVCHDNSVSWLAYYKDTVNGNFKYVFLGAGSGVKGQKDHMKYGKARKLKDHIDAIRADYTNKIKSSDLIEKQLGTATYMLDVLALRVGNEKDSSEEADTVGCCSLRVEHISFDEENSSITLDFLGKDSIRYLNTTRVDPLVLKNLKAFCKKKKKDDDIFDEINPTTLNKYLKDMMEGLSAKVFRTYNASITLQQELSKLDTDLVDIANPEAIKQFYDSANRAVAILCNHQRSIPKQHESSMDKMKAQLTRIDEEINEIRAYIKWLAGKQKTAFVYKPSTQSVDEEPVPYQSVVKSGMRDDIAKKKLLQLE